jgi:hypothetical protein
MQSNQILFRYGFFPFANAIVFKYFCPLNKSPACGDYKQAP